MYDYYEPGSIKKAIVYSWAPFLLFPFVDLHPQIMFRSSAPVSKSAHGQFLATISIPSSILRGIARSTWSSQSSVLQAGHTSSSHSAETLHQQREWPSVGPSTVNFDRQVGLQDVTRADPLHVESRYLQHAALGDVLMR